MSDRFFIFINKKRLFVSVTYSLLNLHCDKLQKKEKLSSFYDAVIDLFFFFTAAAYCCRQMKTIHLQMKSFLRAVENIFILKTSAFFLKSSHRLFFYRKIKVNGKHPFSTERCLASNLSFIFKMTRLSVIIICSICSKLFVSVFSKTFVLCSVASLVFFAEETAVLYGCPCVFGLVFFATEYIYFILIYFLYKPDHLSPLFVCLFVCFWSPSCRTTVGKMCLNCFMCKLLNLCFYKQTENLSDAQ